MNCFKPAIVAYEYLVKIIPPQCQCEFDIYYIVIVMYLKVSLMWRINKHKPLLAPIATDKDEIQNVASSEWIQQMLLDNS